MTINKCLETMTKTTLINTLSPEIRALLEQMQVTEKPAVKLKKAIPTPEKAPPVESKAPLAKDWRAHLETIRTVQQWLQQKWPNGFDLENPKPLKRHIEQDIIPHLEDHLTRTQLRKALQAYTGRLAYLQSILNMGARYGLEGEKIEDIPAEQLEFTRQKIATKEQKFLERKAAFMPSKKKKIDQK